MNLDILNLSPEQRRDTRSDLAKAKAKSGGKTVNACPFGCADHELDEQGYCYHVVGFTNDQKKYEPLVTMPSGRRQIQVPMKGRTPQLPKVLKGDKLVRGSVSYRVYRDIPKPVELREPEDDDDEITDDEPALANAR